jgi:alpha-L-fucosidase 2
MLTRRHFLNALPAATTAATAIPQDAPEPMTLWYSKPAERWLDALPIGNGRLGAMIFGGAAHERIALNESTVWSGAPSTGHENPAALEHLARIRRLFFEGKYIEARDLCARYLLGRELSYGSHLPMADVRLEHVVSGDSIGSYRRMLNLDEAIARVEYLGGDGVHRTSEYIASNPDGVIAIRLTAAQPGLIGFRAAIDGGNLPFEARTEGDRTLVLTGQAREKKHSDGKTGVVFEVRVQVIPGGGVVHADGRQLSVEHADSAILLIAAATNYGGRNPEALSRSQLKTAAARSWDDLRKRHIADYQPLFRRVTIDLGAAASTRSTSERLAAVRSGQPDPQLSALFFQYGRYLLIAGSRADSPLPTNLQGIWNDNLACNMGWTCDFHLDINTQQNYWHAESANLAECHEALFKLVESIREHGRRTARTMYGARGWVCHVFTNAWGYTAPGWGLGWGLHVTGGVWLASHMWEHYRYTGDRAFLARRAYPVLKEAAEFFLDYMVEHPKYGWLVTGPAVSPENAFVSPPDGKPCSESMGPTCDRVLIDDLFASCLEATRILGIDGDFRARVAAARGKLPPLKMGHHGQLQEWLEDFEDAVPNHRHTTHLLALHPSSQITPRGTPALARAARVTIERRTSARNWEDVEWSRANLINFFARLGDGDGAHRHLAGLLAEDTDNNLLTFSRGGIAGAPENIFCIDGNSAGACGIVEMLLQSHSGEIHLLPALPAAWPTGSVRGLRARGGFEVSIEWTGGKLSRAVLRSVTGTRAPVRYGEKVIPVKLQRGQRAALNGELGRI